MDGSYLLYLNEDTNCSGYYSVNIRYSTIPERRSTNEPFDISFQRQQGSNLHVQCPISESNRMEASLNFMLGKNFRLRPTSVGSSDIWETFCIVDHNSNSLPYSFKLDSFSDSFPAGLPHNRVDLIEIIRIIRSMAQ